MTIKPEALSERIAECCGVNQAVFKTKIQNVWSAYGSLLHFVLEDKNGHQHSAIVKHISPPLIDAHPRGWHSDFAHQRKLKSYQIEISWYRQFNSQLTAACVTPTYFGSDIRRDSMILVLGDLRSVGFTETARSISAKNIAHCIHWLADFHAQFMTYRTDSLWPQGNYWHLGTRPDEFAAMPDSALKHAASTISQAILNAKYRCLIHGDAKVANFCFKADESAVAALDFQYIGGGIGVQDLIYFLGSCVNEKALAKHYDDYCDQYFSRLTAALSQNKAINCGAIESEWRQLMPVVWADFQRFLQGWSPNHSKDTDFSRKQTQLALTTFS